MGKLITQLAVVRASDGWSLLGAGRRWGTFRYRVDAEEAALRLLRTAQANGQTVLLLVQSGNGELRPLDVA